MIVPRDAGTTERVTGDHGTCVLALGVRAPHLLPAFASVPHVNPESREDVFDQVAAMSASGSTVLVVHPTWAAEPTRHWLEVARSAMGTTAMMTYETSLPPAAAGVLSTLAGSLAAHTESPGALLALLPVLEQQLQVIALLPDVHKLEHPGPTLWQHACSLMGTHTFAVVFSGRRGRVLTVRRSGLDLDLPEPAESSGVHVASGGGDPMWMYGLLDSRYPNARLHLEADVDDPHGYWGGSRWIEAVAYPTEVRALLRLARQARPLVACRWCGAKGPPVERICQFCGVALTPPSLLGVVV